MNQRVRDASGWFAAPVHGAAEWGRTGAVAVLIAAGCRVGLVDSDGDNACHWASEKGHAKTLKLLLAAGCPADQANALGATPAHVAAYNGHTDALAALVAAGADVNAADAHGVSPFAVPPRRRRPLSAAPRATPRAQVALAEGSINVLRLLLRAGAALRCKGAARREHNALAWDYVDGVRAAGGWRRYVRAMRAESRMHLVLLRRLCLRGRAHTLLGPDDEMRRICEVVFGAGSAPRAESKDDAPGPWKRTVLPLHLAGKFDDVVPLIIKFAAAECDLI